MTTHLSLLPNELDLKYCLEYEKAAVSQSIVLRPAPFDVLSGQGRKNQAHPGNMRYNELLSMGERKFLVSDDRHEKQGIVYNIIREIHAKGRFLVYEPLTKTWHLMKEDDVYAKVSQALRYRRRLMMKLHRSERRILSESISNMGFSQKKHTNGSKIAAALQSSPVTTLETRFIENEGMESSLPETCRSNQDFEFMPLSTGASSDKDWDPVPLESMNRFHFKSSRRMTASAFMAPLEESVEEIFSEPKPFTRLELSHVLEAALTESDQFVGGGSTAYKSVSFF